jgi:tetratricopeptide (TPR) repeat protein
VGFGHLYVKLGRPHDAMASYRKALKLEPARAAEAALALGSIYMEFGRPDDALAIYLEAAALAPEDARPYQGLGDLYRDAGDTERALEVYRQAIQCDPDSDVYGSLGDIYYLTGEVEDAVAAYRQALEHNPRDAFSRASLAGIYRKLGRQAEYEEHLAMAREVIVHENEYNRACFEAIQGNADEAIALLRIALDKRLVSPALIRRDPDFDFIRDDPRFKALIEL